ncbi:MAG: hypothetical protein RQ746_15565 [Bacteroidales bacterium]|nr:hypothetical protein [Bacteroidales bacterium]
MGKRINFDDGTEQESVLLHRSRGDRETGRRGDGETGRPGDGEMGDQETGRWETRRRGDGEGSEGQKKERSYKLRSFLCYVSELVLLQYNTTG